ncbi:hypothetical protein [Micromonospora sp. DPT]|uniref:hypothetical protein n=1 Tax=Micromonospora sp. DPT TaxID=3142975 RepID=UPI00320ADEA3
MSESGAAARGPNRTIGGPEVEPDVLLDVPRLSVDSLRLAVEGLDADLSLRARLANLLQLDAGVRVHLERVELDIEGVRAEAVLKVRLEKVLEILDRALTTIDRNPQIIEALAKTPNLALNDVNRVADRVPNVARPVVHEAGQQVGQVGQVAGQQAGQPAPAAPERPAGPRPESPAGPLPVGSPQEPPLGPPPSRQAGTEGGRPADRGTTAGDRESRGEAEGGGRGEQKPGEHGQGGPEGAQGGRQQGGAAPASQLAEQAGETLRQAGRSVWEAIQGGMAQRRQGQQRRDR